MKQFKEEATFMTEIKEKITQNLIFMLIFIFFLLTSNLL